MECGKMEISPMLLTEVEDDMTLIKYQSTGPHNTKLYQEKHNGVRAIIHVKDHKIVGIRGRSNNPLLYCYPELKEEKFLWDTAILDAEIVVLKDGKSVFYGGIDQRRTTPTTAKLRDYPVSVIVFDAIQLENDVLINKPYKERLGLLQGYRWGGELGGRIHLVETTSDGEALWNKVILENREGIVVKDPNGIYELGKRSKQYIKIKNYKYVDVTVDKTEPNPKGTKIFSTVEIDGKTINVECQQAGAFSIMPGDIVRVKYLDIVGERLIQPTRW